MSAAAPPAPTPAEVSDRFRRLAAQWKEQSRFLSNTAQMALLRPYLRIIGMGWAAVPHLLDELAREGLAYCERVQGGEVPTAPPPREKR